VLPFDDTDRTEPVTLYRHRDPDEVMWAYLEEIPRMVAGSSTFAVFTHLDYAARSWPASEAGPFDPRRFEEGFRAAMRAIAQSERALEMNTRRLWPWMPQWWSEEGGMFVTFGSDAHDAGTLAANFPEAMAMLEHFGFRAGTRPEDFWGRTTYR
jgi:histidinol-phosphatase (PHP family)